MTKVVFDLSLYSTTPASEIDDCEWRAFLKSQPRQWKDLNYGNCDEEGLQACVTPLNSWLDESSLTTASFPFVIYQYAEEGKPPAIVLIKTLDELKQDPILNAA